MNTEQAEAELAMLLDEMRHRTRLCRFIEFIEGHDPQSLATDADDVHAALAAAVRAEWWIRTYIDALRKRRIQ